MTKIRSWLAYKLMGWALWFDLDTVVRLSLAMSAAHAKQHMAENNISHFEPVHDEEGRIVMQPVFFDMESDAVH